MDCMQRRNELLKGLMLNAFDKVGKSFEDGRNSILGARGFYTLYILGAYGHKNMTELGDACNMKKQQTTKVVDNLTELGFAQRIYNKFDRRVIIIGITESGRDYLNDQIKLGTDRLAEKVATLSEEKQRLFYQTVDTLNPLLAELPK